MPVRTAEGHLWLSATGLARLPMFTVLVVSYSIVHFNFERVWWFTDDVDIFSKYAAVPSDEGAGAAGGDVGDVAAAAAASAGAMLNVAKSVYFTKATWMILLVWLLAAGLEFPAALSWSFVVYALELVVLFPPRTYTMLNALLAVGVAVEQVVECVRARRRNVQRER
jgi:hypothetical protein